MDSAMVELAALRELVRWHPYPEEVPEEDSMPVIHALETEMAQTPDTTATPEATDTPAPGPTAWSTYTPTPLPGGMCMPCPTGRECGEGLMCLDGNIGQRCVRRASPNGDYNLCREWLITFDHTVERRAMLAGGEK